MTQILCVAGVLILAVAVGLILISVAHMRPPRDNDEWPD